MVANIVIGGLIFGYAGWVLWKYIKKSKEGKCAACAVKKSCPHGTGSCGTNNGE